MGESEEKEFIRMTSVQRAEALRAEFEEDLQTAWERGREAGKEGVIRVAVNLLRAGIAPAVTAKAAELPELIIRKLAQDNGIVLP